MAAFGFICVIVSVSLLDNCLGQNFILNDELLSFENHEALCSFRYGTSLASIHSVAQNEEARALCSSKNSQDDCWIGLNDKTNEGHFEWTDGSPFDFGTETNKNVEDEIWKNGEPSNSQGTENCVEFYKDSGNLEWNDDQCHKEEMALCNYPKLTYIINDESTQRRSNSQIGPVHILDELYIEFSAKLSLFDAFQPNNYEILSIGNTVISLMISSGKSYFHFSQKYVSNTQAYISTELTPSVWYNIVYHLQQDHLTIAVNGDEFVDESVSSHQIQNDIDILINNSVYGLKVISSSAIWPNNEYNYLCDFDNRFSRKQSGTFPQSGCTVDCADDYGHYGQVAWMGDLDQSSLNWADYKIESEIYLNNGAGYYCIAFRMQDMNYNEYRYCLHPADNKVRLWIVINSVAISFLTVSVDIYAGTTHTLRVEVSANLFVAYLNGIRIGQGTDDIFSSGSIGLRYREATIKFNSLRIMFPNDNKLYTINPTTSPTSNPTLHPTEVTPNPTTNDPTIHPTFIPTPVPTGNPTSTPTRQPTTSPSTPIPSVLPTHKPSSTPTTIDPTTQSPTTADLTSKPTVKLPSISQPTVKLADGAVSSSVPTPNVDTNTDKDNFDELEKQSGFKLTGELVVFVACGCVALCCFICLICVLKQKRNKKQIKSNIQHLSSMESTEIKQETGAILSVSSNINTLEVTSAEGNIESDFEAGLKTNIVADDMMMDDVVEMMNVTPMGPTTNEIVNIDMTDSDLDNDDAHSDQMELMQAQNEIINPVPVFEALPKSVSEVKLEYHQTARLTLDDNGVRNMLKTDEIAEMEEYEEGNSNIGDDDIIIVGDEETTKG